MSSLLQLETRKTLPVDFSLLNEQDLNTLYITDGSKGQTLRIELANSAGEQLDLLPSDTGNIAPAAPNIPPSIPKLSTGFPRGPVARPLSESLSYNFELVFRPGVLSEQQLGQLSVQESAVIITKSKNTNGSVSIQIRMKPRSLAKGEKITITLLNVFADGRLGSRGTRVMLRYFNVQVHGADRPITGFRETHLNIVTHLGKQNIPLYAGIVGSAKVLNNGVANPELLLRISNVSKDYAIQPGDASQPLSFFFISFDVGTGTEEWALGRSEEVDKIIIKYKNGSIWQDAVKVAGSQGMSPEWKVPVLPIAKKSFTDISQKSFMDISVSNIVTSHPAGNTSMQIRYENIPGYWDGHFTTTIEKSPLVFRNGQIGAGIVPTTGTLHVFNAVQFPIATESSSEIGTWFRMNNTSNGGRAWNLISTGAINGEGTGNFLIKQDNDGPVRLMLDAQGRVGMGTIGPSERLQIGDFDNSADTYLSVKTAGGNRFKAGLKFRHFSEDFGYTIVSDEVVNGLQIIGRHGPDTPAVPVLDIRGWADYSVDIKATRMQVSGGINAMELIIEADTDNNGNDRPVLTMKRHGGNTVGQVGFLETGNKDFLLSNQATKTSVRLASNGNAHLCSATTFLAVQADGNVCIYRTDGNQALWATRTNISDIRLKADIQPIRNPLERLTSLQGISFSWKDKTIGKERELGLIAQEVQQVFPELMHHLSGQESMLVQYEKFVPVLIEAVKEQQRMIEVLREKVGN